ncbi:cation:proton antiporter [Actinophytocola oryzae]|uniref:Kef-type K+ transport system membrane component KefB n=1 Tax=Actinophytocola oryzae TaxID=502181 RepID=A0A4R7VKA7_9PSEU|nr:cation:proton antiporter [Actinophytocola oryzae]TDV49665.1 Kef-type K+ transport system membrane component KefB [Actinophytocola oryzae]
MSDETSWVSEETSEPRWRVVGGYVVLAVVPAVVSVVLLGRLRGGPVHQTEPVPHVAVAVPVYQALFGIALIMAGSHAMGALLAALRQPRVIGEIAAGLLLGPSVLGVVAPGLLHALWTSDMIAFLSLLAQLGVVFFMFLVGRDTPFSLLRNGAVRALVSGHATIALPFLSGVVIASTMLAGYRQQTVSPLAFVMFCGIGLSITAFPVLARILSDRGLRDTRVGVLGMATAGVADVSGWCVLALIVAIARGNSTVDALRTVGLTVCFAAAMWWLVRPALARLSDRAGDSRGWLTIVMMTVLLCSAAITQAIGVQAIFGAFLAGVIAPRSRSVTEFAYRLEGPTTWFLMPLFFAVTGIQVSLGTLGSGANWLVIVVLVAVAMAAKLVAGAASARVTGMDGRSSLGLGVMMTCRGMTELIVLQLGLSLGIISGDLYVMLLVMALVTTALTGPLLGYLLPRSRETAALHAPVHTGQ